MCLNFGKSLQPTFGKSYLIFLIKINKKNSKERGNLDSELTNSPAPTRFHTKNNESYFSKRNNIRTLVIGGN